MARTRRQRVAVFGIATATAISVVIGAAGERGAGVASAAPAQPSAPSARPAAPSADKSDDKDKTKKKPPLLKAGDKLPDGRECVGSQYTTLGHVADLVIDGVAAGLPGNLRAQAPVWKAQAQRDLKNAQVSMLSVSGPVEDLTDNEDAPIHKYKDPISQMIVTQLVNVREGKAHRKITAQNLSMAQAIETVWLYTYVTVLVPLTIFRRTIGSLGQIGPISIGTAISIPILLGTLAANLLYRSLETVLLKACLDKVTPEQKAKVGQPNLPGGSPSDIPAAIREVASQVMVADPKSCPAIGEMPLSRVVTRTIDYMVATNPNPAVQKQITKIGRDLQRGMGSTWAPVGAIPADPADFTTIESVTSSLMTLIPYIGGAPTDMAIGWKHNLDNRKDPRRMERISDVKVTESLTAAYYAWAVSAHVVSQAWEALGVDAAAGLVEGLIPGIDAAALMPRGSGILNAPNTYGLVIFHNVLRSTCLASDYRPEAAQPAAGSRDGRTTKVSTPATRKW